MELRWTVTQSSIGISEIKLLWGAMFGFLRNLRWFKFLFYQKIEGETKENIDT